MPLREAADLAGSLEALLPYLQRGDIFARHGGLYGLDGTPKKAEHDRIPADWWSYVLHIDLVTGRVRFAVDVFFRVRNRNGEITADTLAIGIELEREAVARCFNAGPRKGRGGRPVEYSWPEWEEALDAWLTTHPRPEVIQRLVDWSEEWFQRNDGAVPDARSIREHLKPYYPCD